MCDFINIQVNSNMTILNIMYASAFPKLELQHYIAHFLQIQFLIYILVLCISFDLLKLYKEHVINYFSSNLI